MATMKELDAVFQQEKERQHNAEIQQARDAALSIARTRLSTITPEYVVQNFNRIKSEDGITLVCDEQDLLIWVREILVSEGYRVVVRKNPYAGEGGMPSDCYDLDLKFK